MRLNKLLIVGILACVALTCSIFAACMPAVTHVHRLIEYEAAPATCEIDGHGKFYYCKDCNGVYLDSDATQLTTVEELTLLATGHEVEFKAATVPTCATEGGYARYECKNCKKCFKDQNATQIYLKKDYSIPAEGHNIAIVPGTLSDCFTTGVKKHYKCRICKTLFSDFEGTQIIKNPETLQATKHEVVKVEKKDPVGYLPGWIEHYTCHNCGTLYSDADGKNVITSNDIIVEGEEFEYKIAFAAANKFNSVKNNGANYISAEFGKDIYGNPATVYTLKEGAKAEMEVSAPISPVLPAAMDSGYNLRIPTFQDKVKTIELIVTNNGGEKISFYYFPENYGEYKGQEVTVDVGQTVTYKFEVSPGKTTVGCNYNIRFLSDVTVDTTFTLSGYFYCEDEVSGVSVYKEAKKTSFAVGESFTCEGLILKALGTNYDGVIITNYLTDIQNGYVFTEKDVGVKKVTAYFGAYTVSYSIEIVASE